VGGGNSTRNPDGSFTFTRQMSIPIPVADVWSVVSDGSVAFVRGLDYHIDWVNADGSHTSTPKIAHDWHRLSDSEKSWILDSVKTYYDSVNRVNVVRQAKQDSINHAAGAPVNHTVMVWPDPADFPDYRPPVSQFAIVRGDAEGNLWIQQGGTPSSLLGPGSPLLFDVVNRQGVLIDRVQLPPTLSLAGFGPGVVYMTSREGAGVVLVKYRIH
jgi:hypothetical protein